MNNDPKTTKIDAAGPDAPAIWRSLDDLAGTPEFQAFAAKEFPGFANIYESLGEAELIGETEAASTAALNRRQFVALSAAAIGLAGLSGCRRPELPILPYSSTPDFVVPGMPLYYATSMPRPGGCFPILVESHEGRPTKIEGNPKHPAAQGATDAYAQASILDLYSPDRSREVLHKRDTRSWEEFDAFAAGHFSQLAKKQGEGLHVLIEDQPSPALSLLREHFKSKFPNAVWYMYEPSAAGNGGEGTKLAFHYTAKRNVKDDKGEEAEKDVAVPLVAGYDFRRAQRVVALDCDFLGLDGNQVANSRGFAERRRLPAARDLFAGRRAAMAATHDHTDLAAEMSRLYVLENTYSVTGTLADHRLRIPAGHVADYAVALAREITALNGIKVAASIRTALEHTPPPGVIIPEKWIKEVAADLASFKGKSLILAGHRQPPLVHALCAFINDVLGNTGKTVVYRLMADEQNQSIEELAKAIDENKVQSLLVIGGNPAWNAPADLEFAAALGSVPTVIRLGQFVDETSAKAMWHLPQAHFLESWGDAETADGTYSVIQPLIAPLHGGRSMLELLIQFSNYENAVGHADAKSKVYALLQKSFAKRTGKEEELPFKRFIHEGFVQESARPPVKPVLNEKAIAEAVMQYRPTVTTSDKNWEVSFHLDYRLFDGRFAWNGWLLEMPDPISKLSWDNGALVSPKAAAALQLKTGDMLEISSGGRSIGVPAFILPGQAEHSISVTLGYGKLRPARIAEGGGFDVYPLRTTDGMHFKSAAVKKTGGTYELVTTQEHGTIPEGKEHEIIRDYTLAESNRHVAAPSHGEGNATAEVREDEPKSRLQWGYRVSSYADAGPEMKDVRRIALQTAVDLALPQRLNGASQWGMVIDLNTCTGCSACMVACQSENNIPIVGKNEIKLNREMHWISLHRYFMQTKGAVHGGLEQSPSDDPAIVSQPMMCQQCEAAPCESVCPVNAAVHSPEGLNLQVYNRCIGTRYCSNNCPYKARRFNWFDFNKRRLDQLRVPTPFSEAGMPETLKMQKNPEVTVRMRGVMEKCTYCVQRLERAKIGAKVLAIKAGDAKIDAHTTNDPQREYRQGYAVRDIDGASQVIVPDGIIKTACEQACPSGAIVFGNVRDEQSRVYKLKNQGPDYLVLGELNTKPRTSYLPRLRNLNPKMAAKEARA